MSIRAGQPPASSRRSARQPWLVPPRLLTTEEAAGHRHATWLELFFDLVFVVAITQLSHVLVLHHSTAGFLRFAGLFVPVYVAWQGYMAYATRFDTDDLGFRGAYFAAMLAVAAMAVLIDDVARGVNSAGFAVYGGADLGEVLATAPGSPSPTRSSARSCSPSTGAPGAPSRLPGR